MDLSIISTYRCNSHCSMCNIWKNPSVPAEEISLETLRKLPEGFDNLNITGGEPSLRSDLMEMVDILYPKARILEISSNGLKPDRFEPIIRKYPKVKIRFSLDGLEENNNRIRGEEDGFKTKVNGLKRLQDIGGIDLGFAITLQDDNINDFENLFNLTSRHNLELATSTLHNGFQFHKHDTAFYDRLSVAKKVEGLITAQLRTFNIKNWFRAFLNLGLIAKILGNDRIIPCTAASDFLFIDPWSDVYACNVRPDLRLGNLEKQSWEEILFDRNSLEVRKKVQTCRQNCWMVGSARTAMRNSRFPFLPRLQPLLWVLENKFRLTIGLPIQFARYIDYSRNLQETSIERRDFYPAGFQKRKIQYKDQPHYRDTYENR